MSQFGSCRGQDRRWTLQGPLKPSSNICKWTVSAVTGQWGRFGECWGRQSRSPDGRSSVAHSSRRPLPQPSPDSRAADHTGHVTSSKPGANWLPKLRGLPPTVAQKYFGNYVSQRVLRRGFLSALFLRGAGGGGEVPSSLCLWGTSAGAAPGGRDLRVWKYPALWRRGTASRRRAALFAQRPLGSAVTWSRAPPRSRGGSSSLPALGSRGCGGNSGGKRRDRVGFPHQPRPTSRRRRAQASVRLPPGYHQRECPFYSVVLRVFQA